MNKLLRDRQQEQLERFLAWEKEQGTLELPVRLDTLLSQENQARIVWLARRIWGLPSSWGYWSYDLPYIPDITTGRRILEVGCNWGYILANVRGQVGVDINPALVQLASALSPTREFQVADARSLPFPDRSFDIVMLPEVLEHLPWEDVPLAIKEAQRVGREVFITVPNGDLDSEEAHNFKHRYLMTRKRLDSVLVDFERIIGVETVGPFYCVEALCR